MQKRLDIISLGPGRIDQMTLEAKQALLKSKKIYCRFINPILEYFIKKHKKVVISLQRFYSNPILVKKSRKKLYFKIAELMVNAALINKRVAFVLPGSALIAEDTPYLIYRKAKAKGLRVNTILGISFIDVLLNSLPEKYKKHAIDQFELIPPWRLGTTFFDKRCSYIIFQVNELFDHFKPAKVKEILSRYYPKEFKFLYVYPEYPPHRIDYRIKTIEFQVSDITRLKEKFEMYSGSVFLPAKLIDAEKSYRKTLIAFKRYHDFVKNQL